MGQPNIFFNRTDPPIKRLNSAPIIAKNIKYLRQLTRIFYGVTMADLTRLSKFLSLLLRHKAYDFGLEMDNEGFTDLKAVWAQIHKRYGIQYTPQDLADLLKNSADGKQRFELKDGRVRALYGHSGITDILYLPVIPPEFLYHGTTDEVLEFIRKEGLTSQARQYVHLSTEVERAAQVGKRHPGNLSILRILARKAHESGHVFHLPEPKHYLVKSVPVQFIQFPNEQKKVSVKI
jgi:putative RNA 2'-phosphotransferase